MRVADVMVTDPKRLPATATAGRARAVLDDGHVHMVLLVEGDRLAGTVVRDDLEAVADDRPALWGRPARRPHRGPRGSPRTPRWPSCRPAGSDASPSSTPTGACWGCSASSARRTGFCSDADVADRAAGPRRSGLRTP